MSQPPGDGAQQHTASWWRDVATRVAVFGLLLTMVFNTIAVCQQTKQAELATDQARRERKDTQVTLLTQLNALAAEAEGAVVASRVQKTVCDLDDPTGTQSAAVYRAAGYYNFLAYLFLHDEIVMKEAEDYATPRMLDMYDLAADAFDLDYVSRAYPELRRFKDSALATAVKRPDPCKR